MPSRSRPSGRRSRSPNVPLSGVAPTPSPAAPPGHEPAPVLRDGAGARAGVVHLTAELAPYARTGGLGEAVATLARFQAKAGIPVVIFVPYYREVARRHPPLARLGEPITFDVGGRTETVELLETTLPGPGPHPRIVFVAAPHYFDRDGIYGDAHGDYRDNARRWACFCLGALAAIARVMDDACVVHAHDWHAALAITYLRTWFARDPRYARHGAVASVHNAGFQGHFPTATMGDLGLPWEAYNVHQLEWYGRVNLLKGGTAFADAVVTVSPTHADELRTADGGFGLHEHFRSLGGRFVGITNGIDQDVWNPATDPHIPARFSAADLEGKATCKASLQRLYGMPLGPRTPVVAMSARMVYQKGLDLILDSGFLELPAQFLFLGAGEACYERALSALAREHPATVGVQLHFTDRFEHRLLAGADICLMPSMYEPCGLTQMRAQRYGALPLARRVGGLADTVEDGVTGFLFDEYTAASFLAGAARAVHAYGNPPTWQAMQRAAMARDFGWDRAEARYRVVYQFALDRRAGEARRS